jgi:hypothetical protein
MIAMKRMPRINAYLKKEFQAQIGHKIDAHSLALGLAMNPWGAATIGKALDEGFTDNVCRPLHKGDFLKALFLVRNTLLP